MWSSVTSQLLQYIYYTDDDNDGDENEVERKREEILLRYGYTIDEIRRVSYLRNTQKTYDLSAIQFLFRLKFYQIFR